MNIPKSPFEIRLTIGQHYKWKNEAGVISLNLKRVSLGLLLGSFYVPTGIFAALSVGSYVINPDIVSIIALYSRNFQNMKLRPKNEFLNVSASVEIKFFNHSDFT